MLAGEDPEISIRFLPGRQRQDRPHQIHLHLTSTTPEQQQSTVDRALRLGARHLDIGQTPEEGHIVLADPEGNELCVIEAGNTFLADTAFLGELACDGTREVGLFWSAGPGLAARLGPRRGDGDPVAPRRREDRVGRAARASEVRAQPSCTST